MAEEPKVQEQLTPEQMQQMKNELEEMKRKKQEAEQQLEELRRQNLEMMAQMSRAVPPVTETAPAPTPVEESTEDLDSLFIQAPSKAVKKMLEKEKETLFKDLPKYVSEEAAKVFYRERFKQEAFNRYPELKNPSSEFYKKVANFMYERPHLYQDPEGILHACARVAEEMGIKRETTKKETFEEQRRVISSAGVEGERPAPPVSTEPELDVQGKELAKKLGISEKAMAERLNKFLKKEAEYAEEPGTGTYKARI